MLPHFIRTDILFLVIGVAQTDLCLEIIKVKGTEDNLNNLHYADKLVLYLIRTAVNVSIVLCKAAYTGQSVQFTTLLVTVYGSELGQTQRQILVTAGTPCEDFAVVRTVHGLEHVFLALFGGMDRLEAVLAVMSIVLFTVP